MPPVSDPWMIDIEASGFGYDSYPIEIGLAMAPGQRFSTLVTPSPQWTHWDESAARVHGLRKEQLLHSGQPLLWVAQHLNQLLGTRTIYSDAWVVDQPWLRKLYRTAQIPQTFHLSPIERLLSDQQLSRWDALKAQVTTDLALDRHRASNDAWIVQETYQRCLQSV